MGGKIAKKLGDGLMALFGYPGALGIVLLLNRKNKAAGRPALAARIAIDTGAAVLDAAGEIIRRCAQCRRAGAGAGRAGCRGGERAGTAPSRRAVRRRRRGSHELLQPLSLYGVVRASGARLLANCPRQRTGTSSIIPTYRVSPRCG
jgi:hypothetical protein